MTSQIFKSLFKLFRKKEEIEFPYRFGIITLSKEAKEAGIDDDSNRIIEIYKNGKKEKEIPYSEEIKKALIEIDEIPIVDEREILDKEDFGFVEVPEFGEVTLRQ